MTSNLTKYMNNIESAKKDIIYAIIPAVYNVYQASLKTCEDLLHKHLDNNKVRLDIQHIHFALLILGNKEHSIYNTLDTYAQKFINHKKDYGGKPFNYDIATEFLNIQFTSIAGECPRFTEDFILFWCAILNPVQE